VESVRHLWESTSVEVVVATHPSAVEHNTGHIHPERPERIAATLHGVRETGLPLVEIESPEIGREDLALVHDSDYVEVIEAFCGMGGGALDVDTFVSRETWTAALTAAGGVKAVVEMLEQMTDAVGFVAARPPGHHALRRRAMGFCIFNNVAVTAAWLRTRGLKVAVLDWDVHHGNGTQSMLGPDPEALYVSVHQSPFYPFEGHVDDIDLEAKGTTVNIPLPAGTAGDVYRRAWDEVVIPAVGRFAPDWVLVSAGYDAHTGDPLADLDLLDSDYGWMSSRLAETHPPNRTVFVLEGGYDLDALRHSARSTLLGASGERQFGPPLRSVAGAAEALERAQSVISGYRAT
jgi:acetoin utilization deacetylase AcuC-like enzyme